MNERIIKLGLESGMLNYVDHETPRHYFLCGYANEKDLEKFAELIVRECIDCAVWVGKNNHNPVEPIHTAHAVKQRIEKHFGVE
jgi:hypothetical protein